MVAGSRAIILLVVLGLTASALAGCINPFSDEGKNLRSGPGSDARLYIRSDPHPKLHVVIDYVPGYAPNDDAVNVLLATMREVLDKTEVTLSKHGDLPKRGDTHVYTVADLNALEREYREDYHKGDTAVMHFMYLDGKLQTESKNGCVLGAAYHGSSIVMFKNCIRTSVEQNEGLLGPKDKALETIIERSVLVHEMGHLLGLVDNGIPMQRDHLSRDPNHTPHHSTNQNSVMYWAVESSAALAGLVKLSSNTAIPYKFDSDDLADIDAVKRGA
ncbi:MAG TPA: hypothetical protein VNZ52_07355 [Candidatus Thermoplasmatota archaeon]|nr:hypothetical protein [Candidatus Thermoplasmatota archaeon]